jgi:hypothetical protein
VVRIPAWAMGEGRGARNFPHFHSVRASPAAHPASCSVGTGVFMLGLKQPKREDSHTLPANTKVKNW